MVVFNIGQRNLIQIIWQKLSGNASLAKWTIFGLFPAHPVGGKRTFTALRVAIVIEKEQWSTTLSLDETYVGYFSDVMGYVGDKRIFSTSQSGKGFHKFMTWMWGHGHGHIVRQQTIGFSNIVHHIN